MSKRPRNESLRRVIGVFGVLSDARGPVQISELAARFGVHPRTIYRDGVLLSETLGVTVEGTVRRGSLTLKTRKSA